MASIFRSKHGPLLQRLRYIFRKEQTISSNLSAITFDSVCKNYSLLSEKIIPNGYLIDSSPAELMNEFLTLQKQIQKQKNPSLGIESLLFSLNLYMYISFLY